MFVFVSHLTVPESDCEDLERHFRQRSRLVDEFPGFLYLQLLRTQAGEATHALKSREHAISHGREPGDIMARTEVRREAYEVLMDSRYEPEVR